MLQTRETNSSDSQLSSRNELANYFRTTPISGDDLMTQFGLYTRASILVKTLVLNDLYLRIKSVPGIIAEFGCWYGQNLVMFENLRAIHEPFNKTRRIVGFDTFSGYSKPTALDGKGSVITEGNFKGDHDHDKDRVAAWPDQLRRLLEIHESCNVLGHTSSGHEVVVGDVTQTAPQYFSEHKEAIVALAYFDMGLYAPTKAALAAIKPHLVPGSVILMDELTWSEAKGEAIAFKEEFADIDYKIETQSLTPMRAIVTVISTHRHVPR
jgi:hypothetical protein